MNLVAPLTMRARLSLTGASLTAHLVALAAFALVQTPPAVLAPLNIDVIPQGDYVVDTVAFAGDSATEPTPEPAEPEPAQAARAMPPAPVAPAEMEPDPAARQAELAALEKQRRLREQKRREAIKARQEAAREEAREKAREERLREKRRRAALDRRDALRRAAARGGGSEAHRAGVTDGAPARAARANYGAIISAELNRHKSYPASARARGETGAAGVTFTVGGSGRIVSHSIVASSGSSALDSAIHAMMRAAHAPPPPGGAFHGSIVIRFNLSR